MAMAKCRECKTEVSDEAKTCPKCGISKPVQNSSIVAKIVVCLLGIAFFGSIIDRNSGSTSSQASQTPPAAPKISPKEEALQAVKLDKWDWYKGGFDNVMLLNAKIKNSGTRDVKDIEIECIHSSNSGTRIDGTKKIVYELIKAGKTINISEFGMGFIHKQAKSTSCRITDLVLI